jgi:uncharacterized protein (DUF488 family)
MDAIFTVGHSNRSLEDFVRLLQAHGVARVLDVRRYTASRKWPHFNGPDLARSLPLSGIEAVGLPELGGRRRARADSPHTAWREEAFRGYADFMDTAEFQAGLQRVIALAREKPSALMCAEALPWRCHRSLIADALLVRGWSVREILSARDSRSRTLPEFARPDGTRVVYDVGQSGSLLPVKPPPSPRPRE